MARYLRQATILPVKVKYDSFIQQLVQRTLLVFFFYFERINLYVKETAVYEERIVDLHQRSPRESKKSHKNVDISAFLFFITSKMRSSRKEKL